MQKHRRRHRGLRRRRFRRRRFVSMFRTNRADDQAIANEVSIRRNAFRGQLGGNKSMECLRNPFGSLASSWGVRKGVASLRRLLNACIEILGETLEIPWKSLGGQKGLSLYTNIVSVL